MGLLNRVLNPEPEEIVKLRDRARTLEAAFERLRDYDDLQTAAQCHFDICRLHPDEAKRNLAFMTAHTLLERAVLEGNVETVKPQVVDQAVSICRDLGKTMFLRPLYDRYTRALRAFLERMAGLTFRQLTREKLAMREPLETYRRLAGAAGATDADWFESEWTALERAKQVEAPAPRPGMIHRTYPHAA